MGVDGERGGRRGRRWCVVVVVVVVDVDNNVGGGSFVGALEGYSHHPTTFMTIR